MGAIKEVITLANFDLGLSKALQYDKDCEMLNICRQYHNSYRHCVAGEHITHPRCSPAEKMIIKQLILINQKLDKLIKE